MDPRLFPVKDNIIARDSADPNNGNMAPLKSSLFSYPTSIITSLCTNYGLVPVTIVGVHLSWEAIRNIRAWWKGEISGKRCVKNLIDDLATLVGGFGGFGVGSTIGVTFGPAGWFVGGIVGGIMGSFAMAEVSKRLTETIFDVPRSVALEHAYTYFGLKASCSNGEINSAYHRLALKKHPDKGGSKEEFFELQVNLAIIKHHREDL